MLIRRLGREARRGYSMARWLASLVRSPTGLRKRRWGDNSRFDLHRPPQAAHFTVRFGQVALRDRDALGTASGGWRSSTRWQQDHKRRVASGFAASHPARRPSSHRPTTLSPVDEQSCRRVMAASQARVVHCRRRQCSGVHAPSDGRPSLMWHISDLFGTNQHGRDRDRTACRCHRIRLYPLEAQSSHRAYLPHQVHRFRRHGALRSRDQSGSSSIPTSTVARSGRAVWTRWPPGRTVSFFSCCSPQVADTAAPRRPGSDRRRQRSAISLTMNSPSALSTHSDRPRRRDLRASQISARKSRASTAPRGSGKPRARCRCLAQRETANSPCHPRVQSSPPHRLRGHAMRAAITRSATARKCDRMRAPP